MGYRHKITCIKTEIAKMCDINDEKDNYSSNINKYHTY